MCYIIKKKEKESELDKELKTKKIGVGEYYIRKVKEKEETLKKEKGDNNVE